MAQPTASDIPLREFWDNNRVSEFIEQECHPSMTVSSGTSPLSVRLARTEQVEEIRAMVNYAYRKEGHVFKLVEERKRTNDNEVKRLIEESATTPHGIVCLLNAETNELLGSIFVQFKKDPQTIYFGMLAKEEKKIQPGATFSFGSLQNLSFGQLMIEMVAYVGKLGKCETVTCVVFNVSTALVQFYKNKCKLEEYGTDDVPFKEEMKKDAHFIKLRRSIE
ncbi:hypothetical protein C9374_001380 [Naegleria lovaniensis]|uniref:Uncharacterized protein n=1 Tax=Naegleria lovaniensis TaxID=51637 RepID=A0AA88GXK9_NAELO|nr:uncharacterized protein C9374_001380 [Naegleria lovaniensis]KAG2387786.1 hypothetical protein C9374_001380 [Naegleria lovaniensis]